MAPPDLKCFYFEDYKKGTKVLSLFFIFMGDSLIMKHHFLSFICVFSSFMLAQSQGVLIGSGGGVPSPDAMLEIRSTQSGLLLPRLTTTQRNAIANPTPGLQIFNTSTQCLEAYFSSGWRSTACNCASLPNATFTTGSVQGSLQLPSSFAAQPGATSYQWTFPGGNPATASGQNASTTWAIAGTYTVKLVVTDAQGCADSSTLSYVVNSCPPSGSQTFAFTGSVQSFVVPACANSIQVSVAGAQGANGMNGIPGTGGLGGTVTGTMSVTPGETLSVYVGGQNGWNGGGLGSSNSGNGGGASDIRRNGLALANRVVVAGGGGGGGGDTYANSNAFGGNGGNGGGIGAAGTGGINSCCGGTQGTAAWANGGGQPGQSHNCWTVSNGRCGGGGGAGGDISGGTASTGGGAPGTAGTLGQGGNGGIHSNYGNGGGGGGGYYGGGGGSSEGNGGGGGGGSSFTGNLTSVTVTPGNRAGNGQIVISW